MLPRRYPYILGKQKAIYGIRILSIKNFLKRKPISKTKKKPMLRIKNKVFRIYYYPEIYSNKFKKDYNN